LNKIQKKLVNLYWAKKIDTEIQFDFWNKYIQIVSTIKSTSKIIYKNCSKILNYSTVYDFLNISNIKKYFKFFFCLKQKKSKLQNTIDLIFSRVNLDR